MNDLARRRFSAGLGKRQTASDAHRRQGAHEMLAQKLRDDGGAARFNLADLELEESQVEQVIREILAHVAEPGTPGN